MNDIQQLRFRLAKITVWCWLFTFGAYVAGIVFMALSLSTGAWVYNLWNKGFGLFFLMAIVFLGSKQYKKNGNRDPVGSAMLGLILATVDMVGVLLLAMAVGFILGAIGELATSAASIMKIQIIPMLARISTVATLAWFASHLWLLVAALAERKHDSVAYLWTKLTFEAGEELVGYFSGELLGQYKFWQPSDG